MRMCYDIDMSKIEPTNEASSAAIAIKLIVGSLLIRLSVYWVIKSIFILTIFMVPIFIIGLVLFIPALRRALKDFKNFEPKQRIWLGLALTYVLISVISLVGVVITVALSSDCLVTCRNEYSVIREYLIYAMLYL